MAKPNRTYILVRAKMDCEEHAFLHYKDEVDAKAGDVIVEEDPNPTLEELIQFADQQCESRDDRCDSIVKRELYEEHVKGKFNVLHAWDDRDRVVALWRSLGIPCFQVAEGSF